MRLRQLFKEKGIKKYGFWGYYIRSYWVSLQVLLDIPWQIECRKKKISKK